MSIYNYIYDKLSSVKYEISQFIQALEQDKRNKYNRKIHFVGKRLVDR